MGNVHGSHVKKSLKVDQDMSEKSKSHQETLYVLRLMNDKYFVGVTTDDSYESKNTSEWTKKYPPIGMIYSKSVKCASDEDVEVKKLMALHGIDNVRGGNYCSVTLSEEQILALKR